jgi:hypothetical protein
MVAAGTACMHVILWSRRSDLLVFALVLTLIVVLILALARTEF